MGSSAGPDPGPRYELSPAERALVPPCYDLSALERLLTQLSSEARTFLVRFLACTKARSAAEAAVLLPDSYGVGARRTGARRPRSERVAFLPPQLEDLSLGDPELDALLHSLRRPDAAGR